MKQHTHLHFLPIAVSLGCGLAIPVSAGDTDAIGVAPAAAPALRDLAADRPDATESPITVDRGHWQFEVSFFDWSEDRTTDPETTTRTFVAGNLKYGLTDRSDLQFVFDAYGIEESAGLERESFGDVQFRYKWNLWGNDGGDTAFGLLPFIKVPTGTALSNDRWEGGLAAPLGIELNDRLSLGVMPEIDAVWDEDRGTHVAEFLHTAVLGIGLTERWSAFVEYIGITGRDAYRSYAAGGLVYAVSGNLALDAGAQFGLNEAAEGTSLFTGMTVRF